MKMLRIVLCRQDTNYCNFATPYNSVETKIIEIPLEPYLGPSSENDSGWSVQNIAISDNGYFS